MKPDIRRLTSVERAMGRYVAKLRQGVNPCRADGDSAGQIQNYRDAVERAELRYTQVKQILCDAGVPTTNFIFYRNFGLHLDKLFRAHSDETLRTGVAAAIARWQFYGCKLEVLKAICREVFKLEVD
jgi:hypothetical protein